PNCRPIHRFGAAFDNEGRECDSISTPRNAVPQLIIIGQTILQSVETTDLSELRSSHRHHRAQRKIQRSQTAGLKHLAPEIGVDGYRLPLHRRRRWISQPVKAIHEGARNGGAWSVERGAWSVGRQWA